MKRKSRNQVGKNEDDGGRHMQNIIEQCLKECKIASYYFDKEDNCKHLTGFVHYFNEQELLIAHITPRGEYDGFVLNRMDGLYRVDYDGLYEKKIQHLYELKNQTHPVVPCDEEGIVIPLLKFAFENEYLITFEMENDAITGSVDWFGDYVKLQVIDENGIENGKCIIDIDEVVTISCDTDYEQDLKILNLAQE